MKLNTYFHAQMKIAGQSRYNRRGRSSDLLLLYLPRFSSAFLGDGGELPNCYSCIMNRRISNSIVDIRKVLSRLPLALCILSSKPLKRVQENREGGFVFFIFTKRKLSAYCNHNQ